MKTYFLYIITNHSNKVLYVGVTNSLERRMYEHKNKQIMGFSSKYNLSKLVYFEQFYRIEDAIGAEKKVKGWLRSRKIDLITSMNPEWSDLAKDLDPSLRSG